MRFYTALPTLLLLCVSVASARGQGLATTVQLPTFSYFNTTTTVSVPDRGSVYMGGINRASSGMSEFGTPLLPFRNRSISSERSATSTSVSVTIHDFEAMDRYLRGDSPQVSGIAGGTMAMLAAEEARREVPLVQSTWTAVAPRGVVVEELDRRVVAERELRTERKSARDAEAIAYFQRGQKAEAEGKRAVARIFYQMAGRRADGELKSQVTAKLEAISARQAGAAVASDK